MWAFETKEFLPTEAMGLWGHARKIFPSFGGRVEKDGCSESGVRKEEDGQEQNHENSAFEESGPACEGRDLEPENTENGTGDDKA